jgi:hypothetical protein
MLTLQHLNAAESALSTPFLSTLFFSPRNFPEFIMEAKTPSGPSPGLAQKKHTSDHPLGRILEPLGFYRHPILYATFSNAQVLANPRRGGSRFVFSHLSFYLLSFVVNTVMQIRVVITAGT